MKDKFSKFINLQGKYLTSLLILLALSIGQMWGAEIFSWTVSSALAKDATETATGGSVKCTGSGMGSETPSSSGFFKFNSSTQLTFTLSSETFAAGDVISFTFTSGGNNKTVGVEIQETSPVTQLTETVVTKGTSVTKTYTVAASDGIQGENKFSIKRVDSNFSFKSVSVTRSSGGGTTYTVTLNPGDGAYASTPSGWTASGSNITKTVSAGALTIPEPTRSGYGVSGWKSGSVDVALTAGKLTVDKDTTLTAQWVEVDCKIYSLTGGIGSAEVTASDATVNDGVSLVLSSSSGRIKLTPASGTFKSGDVITVSGYTGNATKKFGVYVKNAAGSSNIATAEETNLGDGYASATLSADAEYVFLARKEGTTMTVLTCEIHRACAEGVAAGLSYATASVDKSTTDAAFTNPLTNANSLIVAGYSTSDAAVATVDKTGLVTIVGAGDATITANSAVQTKAGTLYAAGTATYTLHVTAPATYAVTYAKGDESASGEMTDPNSPYLEGAEVTLLANTFTAPASKEFDAWVVTKTAGGEAVTVSAGKFTMPAEAVTVTATWRAITAKYTVHYMDEDGTTPLGADELVIVGQDPVGITVTKPLFTLAAWQLSGSDIALDDASWASVAANAEVTLTARWAKAYASNADFEAYIIANKSEKDDADKAEAYVKSLNYALSMKTGTTFDANDETNNGAYAGLKIKNAGTVLSWNVVAGKVVELKAGVMVANGSLAINSGTPTTIDGGSTTSGNDNYKIHYFYSATEALYEFTTSNGSAEVIKAITMRDPYTVSFEAHGDADPSDLPGQPSVTLPNATNGTASLLGWFTEETGGTKIGDAGDSYIPTADITLHAQWEAISTDARLASISFSSAAGTLEPAFNPEIVNYTYTMPYGTADVPTITGATSVSAKAKTPVIDAQAANWNDVAHIHGVAESDDTKDYYITMKIEPKDGVSIIKVATTGGTNKTVTGLYAGDGDVNLSSNTKMDKYKFIGFTLDGTTLQAGDQINVHTTTAANTGGSHIIFYDNMTDKNELYETGEIGGLGDNIFEVNAAMIGAATAYVYRSDADAAHQWNGYVDYIEVLRAMNPVLTAITIDGRDGEIDALDDTHFSVTIPYEADLAALTVVPTIVWNEAASSNSIVVNDGSAWTLGDNTYKLTDKDGDATTYTITLIRDVLKHTVSFNTHGGSAVASEEVEDGEKLASAPADPTKEDYIFQGWSATDGGSIIDITDVTIDEDKTFHAVWAAETGVIKLIEAGAINHTNFITGATLSESPVEIETVNYDYALLGGTASSPSGQNQLNKFIAYNATTTQTKVMVNVYNTATSARQVVIKGVVEGSTTITDIATIDLDNGDNKHVKSAYYSFDNAANRTIYISVPSSVGSVDFLQVKVIESGTPLPMFGKIGYSINLNQGRLFGPSSTDLEFEGMTYNLGSNYNALNSTAAVFKKNTSYQVTVPAAVTMTLTTSAAKYYVADATDGTTNETAAEGAHEFDLTAGTWYINVAGSNLNVSSIAFALPKCEAPVFGSLADIELCTGEVIPAIDGTATVSDGGDVTYKWYQEGSETVLATTATYTPAADGSYFVVATNSLAGHQDVSTTSVVVKVAHFASVAITTAPEDVYKHAGLDAELSVVAEGKNVEYEWFTCDDELGTNPVAIVPAETGASLNLTAIETGIKYYQVVVTDECGTSASAVAKVEGFNDIALQDVTGDMTWDFSKDGLADQATVGTDVVMVNVAGVVNNDDFHSDNIMVTANKQAGTKLQASMIKFHTTVNGLIKVIFSNTGNKTSERYLVVNGQKTASGSKNSTAVTYYGFVPAGDVELTVVDGDGNMLNFTSVKFIAKAAPDYVRDDSWMAPGELGTICLEHGAVATGGDVFTLECKNTAGKIVFASVSHMEPGKPYLFQAKSNAMNFYYTDEAEVSEPDNSGAMKGSFTNYTLNEVANVYYFAGHALWLVDADHLDVIAHRAYVKMDEVVVNEPAPMPGRRYITMNVNGEQTATAIDNLNASEEPVKLLIDGQLFILRGEKIFDATGRLVK